MSIKSISSDQKQRIASALWQRIRMSKETMSKRYDQWKTNEEQFKAYIPTSDEDAIRKNRRTAGKPQYTTIQVPHSYAMAMTAHTYYTSVMLGRSPIFQFAGRHGEGEQQIQAAEAIMDYQVQVGGMNVPLFFWLHDPLKYSIGVIGHYWDKRVTTCRKRVSRQATFLGMPIPGKFEEVEEIEDVTNYEGNRIYNCRPQDWFPDTRVPLWDFQRGEFCGRYAEMSWSEVRQGEADGRFFDTEKLRGVGAQATDRDVGSSHVTDLPDSEWANTYGGNENEDSPPFLRAYEVFVKIIPSEWKVAKGQSEEIWVFYMTADGRMIFGAEPLGLYHGQFPFDIIEQEPDAYSVFSRSMLEVIEPLSETLTWLLNSHMYNVRAALNDQFVYDPSMLVVKDVEGSGPGKMMRLKPAAYGRDIRSLIYQLPVGDVTSGHLPNMQMVSEMMQRAVGVTDNVMGMVNAGGRKTATEVRQSTSFGINRLKTNCEFFSAMGFAPAAQKLLQNTQQKYSGEQKFRIVGDLATLSPGFLNVNAESIAGFYDFVPVDGSMPVDRFAQANLWQTMMAQMVKVPQVAQEYDFGKIFAWVGTLAGLKNMQRFKVQVVPDQMLQTQQNAGNVVPIQPPGPGTNSAPQQIQGMGPSL